MLEVEHPLNHLSTYPFRARLLGGEEPMAKGDIYVESDVWLSGGVTVLSGVRIGQGAVIGAGAVVVKDVPPYSVVGGVPSRVIRYRFEKEVIEFLLTLDYDRLDAETALAHMDELYKPIDKMPLDDIKKLYEWFPKKA
ncbi:MAG: CatB-related O-acetyltransferase [Eubacterium sp.]|nr:CatB-related O-acetyltransferase [Eubacterium sp.]